MRIYQHIYTNTGHGIMSDYTSLTDLASVHVIYYDAEAPHEKCYYVLDSTDEFKNWYSTQTKKYHHEVIFGSLPQRIKFDIDAYDYSGDINYALDLIVTNLIELIESIYADDCITLHKDDIIITNNSGHTSKGYKHSYHIIVKPYAVENNIEAQAIHDKLMTILPTEIKDLFDHRVNKSVQNFRLLGASKCHETRVKTIMWPKTDIAIEDTLITAPVFLPRLTPQFQSLASPKKTKSTCINMVDITDRILTLKRSDIAEYNDPSDELAFRDHSIREIVNDTIILFDRVSSYDMCFICKRYHENDNSLICTVQITSSDGYHVYERCRRSPEKKRVYLFGSSPSISIDNHYKNLITNPPTLVPSFNAINVNKYSQQTMRPFELVDTLLVLAQMKMGKTQTLRDYISTNFAFNEINPPIIRFISFRQTFSNDILQNFPDFTSYQDINEHCINGKHKRLIIQVESLHRLDIYEEPDLIILDESESILSQFNSRLHLNLYASWAKFKWLIEKAKHVICMDANISEKTYNLIRDLRGDNILLHWNVFQRAKEDTYYISSHEDTWIARVMDTLNNNKKIAIVTNSLKLAKSMHETITTTRPNLIVGLYSGEISQAVKKEHFNNVDEYWSEYDVLIYTPVCTAGINFQREHYDVVFGHFTNSSCDVESCRQMLGRIRNVRDKTYYIYLSGTRHCFPTHSKIIESLALSKRNILYDGPQEFDSQTSQLKIFDTVFFRLWIEETKIKHLSKNDIYKRFIGQVHATGASIQLDDFDIEEFESEINSCMQSKINVKATERKEILEARDITTDEFCQILSAKSLDISKEDKYAIIRYKLRQYYDWAGGIDTKFLTKYNNYTAKEIYKNLQILHTRETIEDSLYALRMEECERHMVSTMSCITACNDIIKDKDYKYIKHYLVVKLLKYCGIDKEKLSLKETENLYLTKDMLRTSVQSCNDEISLTEAVKKLSQLTGRKYTYLGINNDNKLKRFMVFTNSVLQCWYGYALLHNKAIDIYQLNRKKAKSLYALTTNSKVVCNYVCSEDNK